MSQQPPRFRRLPDRRLARGAGRAVFFEFHLLERHRQEVEKLFAQSAETQQLYMNDLQSSLEEDHPLWDSLADDHHELVHLLPRIQWNSQFIAAYAIFEDTLNQLCRAGMSRLELTLSPKDIGHQGIERAQVYLSKVVRISGPFNSPAWETMKAFGQLRNALAHADAELNVVDGRGKALRQKMLNWPGANLDLSPDGKTGYLTLTSEFLKFAIEQMKSVALAIGNSELDLNDDEEWANGPQEGEPAFAAPGTGS